MGTPSKKAQKKWIAISRNAPINKYPPLIQKLLKKHNNKPFTAAKACGFTGAAWLNKFANGQPFTDEAKAIVERALTGEAPMRPSKTSGALHTVFVIVKSAHFELLYDLAMRMGGTWKLKRKSGGDYIGIVTMPGSELGPFEALAKAKGAEIYGA